MRFLVALAAGVSVAVSTMAAAAASAALVLSFQTGPDLQLVSLSTADRHVPREVGAGPRWVVAATSPSGSTLWSHAFPAPRAFHSEASTPPAFPVVIPRPAPGSLITIRDDQDRVRWTRVVDQGLIATAEAARAKIDRENGLARAATARLRTSTPAKALLRQAEEAQRAGIDAARRSAAAGAPEKRERLPHYRLDPEKAEPAAGKHVVTGHVVANRPITVRAFDAADGRFILSTEQYWASGRFELPLPSGTYIFEVDDNLKNIDSAFFYRAPTRTPPLHIAASTELPDIVPDVAAGTFALLARVPCALVARDNYLPAWIDVWTEDGTHVQRPIWHDTPSAAGAGNLCEIRYVIQLSPGRYAIAASPPGWEPRRIEGVQIIDGQRIEHAATFTAAERTLVWRGTVVDAADRPVSNAITLAYDERQELAYSPWADASGRFEIPYRQGWTIAFEPSIWNASAYSVRRGHAFDGSPLPSKVTIEDLDLRAVMDDGLLRLYGDGNRRNRFNILFLADGYTDTRESYTDLNGNGTWDGYVWHDLDRDGVLSNADRWMFFGLPSTFPPVPGSVPTANNEPFTDLNGDGVLSLDDPALFLINARAFLRSLLGSDFWDAHRDAFNAYALFEPSAQAGYRVVSPSGEDIIARSTRYGATLDQARGLVSIDRVAAVNRALTVLPEVDLVVVLVNQPIRDGRASVALSEPGSLIYPSGPYDTWIREMTPSHEMGHFIGRLCDEYEEFPGINPSYDAPWIWCTNASYSPNVADVPWANWLSTAADIPTRHLDGAIGVYEGADYYPGGAYRPSYASTMRDLSPLFNAPSRAALLRAVKARTGTDPANDGRLRPPPVRFSRIRKPN
ncbi:MAG: hypothetical protein GXC76_15715 [Rhodanobacteraceae bacterium]|jgi:hypothetical protein|nr:hypothetical protein [Rhodanobacteraceae bacterium]